MKIQLAKSQYNIYCCAICCDLKVVTLSKDLQLDCIKLIVFVRMGDCYIRKEWARRESFMPLKYVEKRP